MRFKAGVIGVVFLLAGAAGFLVTQTAEIPDTQAAMESRLDRPLLAYAVWNETPVFVFEFDRDPASLHFDYAQSTCCQKGIPFWHEWQWSGSSRTQANPDDPASAAWVSEEWGSGLWGQVTDDRIVALQFGTGVPVDISGPAFVVPVPDGTPKPSEVSFLDAAGNTLWTVRLA